MPLAPYTEKYWYPDGSPAAGELAYVFPRHSQTLQPLFTDATGTVPVDNPVTIPPDGILSFFADNGDYWVFVRGQSFYVIIDLDPNLTHVWPSTFRHVQAAPLDVWTITHGLKSQPGVSALDASNQILVGDVQYVDDDTLTITFGVPVSGIAYLRR